LLRLRQICLVASELRPPVEDLKAVFGLEECYHDPVVAKYGLENSLMPIGRNFMEIVAPVQDGTAAGRYLERRKGNGGYIVILQCDDAEARRERYETLGVRIANSMDYGDFLGTQLHPRDTGGCMLEVDRQEGDAVDGPWHPASDAWEPCVREHRIGAMTGCTLQAGDSAGLAARWAEILDRPATPKDGGVRIALDNGCIDFVQARDDRGDGLVGVTVEAKDRAAVEAAARARGLPISSNGVEICGVAFSLTES